MSAKIDSFFYKQPPFLFVEELKQPLHRKKPTWFVRSIQAESEVCAEGAFLVYEFEDKEGLLVTATEDFEKFLAVFSMTGDRYPIKIIQGETACLEAYDIEITAEGCTITANDTEGIRRGLIYLEDELQRREGPYLPLGRIARKPVINARITRGFFSPTNRPPKCIDELMDDVDYYPDEYLNRLAHDGTNGLWIYTYFSKLMPSMYFEEYGEDWEKRIVKLRRVVEKCKRYGIKVYVFGVEPAGMPPEMAEKYPDAAGEVAWWSGESYLCTYSERGAGYCVEATKKLLELVPDLGGIIDITSGECVSSCKPVQGKEIYLDSQKEKICTKCKNRSRGGVLAHTVELLQEGVRKSGAKGRFVSWTYDHRNWEKEEIRDYIRNAPEDTMLMENFEDAGYCMQLGKMRQAIDYWLSYAGPSQMFEDAAQTALEHGKHMLAKMQVCCSHELASVPYIPVPGILFDKYAAAHKYRVEGIMQCWYFGNYPSIMSKVAGELAFTEDYSDKRGFLEKIAGIYCGTSQAGQLADAWEYFEEGYKNYPINIMFSYYGPMHDGVVWDLALMPRNNPLPRNWLLLDAPDGDRIGECLQSGHTLEEVIILTDRIKEQWERGIEMLPEHLPADQRTVAEALQLLFKSGNNILKFYQMRDVLGTEIGDSEEILNAMEVIVDMEMENSRKMIALCRENQLLGYHSEAEGYKFFPEKLEDRMAKLRKLKETEFVQARQNLLHQKPTLAYYKGEENGYHMSNDGLEKAEFMVHPNGAAYRMAYDEENIYLELKGKKHAKFSVCFEYQLFWPASAIWIQNGEIGLESYVLTHQSVWGDKIQEELAKYQLESWEEEEAHYILTISREKVGWTKNVPMKLRVAVDDVPWQAEEDPVHTLGKRDLSPGEFEWIMPE
ncbi:MAG: hypothetical protein E7292_12905 [Lachnospiraceae bacterium]|nr:hypothetical protein [Lachnospiraceae bacterium]